jgi:hypothetical protein
MRCLDARFPTILKSRRINRRDISAADAATQTQGAPAVTCAFGRLPARRHVPNPTNAQTSNDGYATAALPVERPSDVFTSRGSVSLRSPADLIVRPRVEWTEESGRHSKTTRFVCRGSYRQRQVDAPSGHTDTVSRGGATVARRISTGNSWTVRRPNAANLGRCFSRRCSARRRWTAVDQSVTVLARAVTRPGLPGV